MERDYVRPEEVLFHLADAATTHAYRCSACATWTYRSMASGAEVAETMELPAALFDAQDPTDTPLERNLPDVFATATVVAFDVSRPGLRFDALSDVCEHHFEGIDGCVTPLLRLLSHPTATAEADEIEARATRLVVLSEVRIRRRWRCAHVAAEMTMEVMEASAMSNPGALFIADPSPSAATVARYAPPGRAVLDNIGFTRLRDRRVSWLWADVLGPDLRY